MSELEPLDADLTALLRKANEHAVVPTDASARLLGRVLTTVGMVPPGGGPGHGPASPAPVTPTAPTSPTTALASAAKLTHLAAFALGATSGVLGYAAYENAHANVAPAPTAVLAEAVTSKPSAPPPTAPATLSVAEAVSAPPVVASPTPKTSAPAPSAAPSASAKEELTRDEELAAERLDLEAARTALTRGQAGAALTALEKHAQRFPRGRLGEERESLWIQALLASGRRGEAALRARAFRDRHPKSLLLPAIDAILGDAQKL